MAGLDNRPLSMRAGFTLIELVIVVSVIIALAAIGFPVFSSVMDRAKEKATKVLVGQISLAITAYQTKTWAWDVGTTTAPRPRSYSMFDLNHNVDNGSTWSPQPDLYDEPNQTGIRRFYSIDGYMPPQQSGGTVPENVTFDTTTGKYTKAPTSDDPEKNATPSLYDVNFDVALLNSGYRGFIAMALPDISPKFINKRGQVIDAWGRPLRIAFAPHVFGTQAFGIWSAGRDGKDSILETDKYKDDPAFTVIDDLRSWESDRREN
jgi:prepilin-type N-terminal cleavage/methylation domain-containing protein